MLGLNHDSIGSLHKNIQPPAELTYWNGSKSSLTDHIIVSGIAS